jgi:serine/threonine-protein kinase
MATVLDFGATPEGDPYVVMELLHGESLGEVLGRERRVEPLRAVGLLLPIIDCLREAHDKGIVHRDIKPENLFIAKAARGRVQPKVLDFGIAKLEQPFGSDTRLTRDGAVLGSPGYFSPEQARGQSDIDFKTDIWSICVVLYELVTGELPFHGANYNALLMSILKDAPAPITTYGYGDAELWRILQRGLSRDRDKRWASMGELGRALATWLHARGVHADITCRSLEDVWLDPRAASEAPPLADGFEPEVVKRRVLSTLVKRRVDTLAGETVANSSPRRLPTRVIGWAAGALGLALIVGSLVRSPRPQGVPISTSAAPNAAPAVIPPPPPSPEPSAAVVAAPAQAPQASTAAPPAPRGATPTPTPSPRAAQGTGAGAQRSSAPARTASSTRSAPDKPTSERTAARAAVASSATSGDASAKPQRTTSAQPVRPKAPKPSGQKAIDQEFGF